MSETTDSPVIVTLKGGAGYEAPWIVLRGDTIEEVQGLLENAANSEFTNLVQDVNAAFRDAGPAVTQSQAGSPAQSTASSGARVYLDVPFREKDAAKAAGARWDKDSQQWFDPNGNTEALAKWRK